MANRIAVIVNGAAGCGYGPDWAASVARKFREAGIDASVEIVRGGSEIVAATRKAIADAFPGPRSKDSLRSQSRGSSGRETSGRDLSRRIRPSA